MFKDDCTYGSGNFEVDFHAENGKVNLILKKKTFLKDNTK